MNGYVLSDLHMYTRRSDATKYEKVIRKAAESADFIVLNGDVVDFKWSVIGGPEATIDAARQWLSALAADFKQCTFHHVLGNHDALRPYADSLESLTREYDNVRWHPAYLQIGTALFHHGDLLLSADPSRHWHRPMHDTVSVKGRTRNVIYDATISARLHKLPAALNTPKRIATRIAHAVRRSPHPDHASVTDVYVGHTHAPFDAYEIAGLRIHNTGSAMKHLPFNMLQVNTDAHTEPSEH